MILIGNSVYTIQEEEQAVVCTFGMAKAVTDPGIHFKVPLIQTVDKVNTTIQGFAIGYSSDYTQNYNGAEGADSGMMITSDYNFIQIDFYAEYRITDPVKALYASEDPVLILANLAQNCIRTTIGSYGVDAVLTTGKNNANKYRNEQLPEAEAEADKILQDAEADKEARINEAKGQVARFNAMYDEYVKYPTITKRRMFYETMEEVLPGLKVVIEGTGGDNIEKILPLDTFSSEEEAMAAAAVYDEEGEEE